jgi:hypothetical protein
MKYLAIHDRQGNITALATRPADAPPATVVADPGTFVTEVEVAADVIDLAGLENEQRVVEALQGFRIETKTEAKLVRKTSAETG